MRKGGERIKMETLENHGNNFSIEKGMATPCSRATDKTVFHTHQCYELLFVPDGVSANTNINGQLIHTDFPMVVINAPYCIHFSYYEENRYKKEWLAFYVGDDYFSNFQNTVIPMKQFLDGASARIFNLTGYYREIEQIVSLIMDMERHKNQFTLANQQLAFGMLANTLWLHSKEEKENITVSEHNYLSDVIAYILQNLDQNLSVPEIAERFFVSRDKLNRDFYKYMQISVANFIISSRINTAKILLRRKKKTVREVAALCGFENDVYFYSFFKKRTGMTPKEYACGTKK